MLLKIRKAGAFYSAVEWEEDEKIIHELLSRCICHRLSTSQSPLSLDIYRFAFEFAGSIREQEKIGIHSRVAREISEDVYCAKTKKKQDFRHKIQVAGRELPSPMWWLRWRKRKWMSAEEGRVSTICPPGSRAHLSCAQTHYVTTNFNWIRAAPRSSSGNVNTGISIYMREKGKED